MTPEENLRLQAYFDDELPARERRVVEDWLESSPEGRIQLEQWQRLRSNLSVDALPVPDPEKEWEDVREQIEIPTRRTRTTPFPRIIGAAAAILAFALVFRFTTAPTPAEESHPVVLVDTEIEDASAIVYVDEESGWTVVWVEERLPATSTADGSA
ncbi:MAG: hypothetical protein AAF546_14065 [Verrucomicrobiota bacterium]